MYLPNIFISTAPLTMRPEYYRSIFLHVKIQNIDNNMRALTNQIADIFSPNDKYQLSNGAECNMRNIFRVLFVSVIFHGPKASEIQEIKRTRRIFPYCTKQRAITNLSFGRYPYVCCLGCIIVLRLINLLLHQQQQTGSF